MFYKCLYNFKMFLMFTGQEPLPVGGITSAYEQKRSTVGPKSDISRVFQLAILGPQNPTTGGDLGPDLQRFLNSCLNSDT